MRNLAFGLGSLLPVATTLRCLSWREGGGGLLFHDDHVIYTKVRLICQTLLAGSSNLWPCWFSNRLPCRWQLLFHQLCLHLICTPSLRAIIVTRHNSMHNLVPDLHSFVASRVCIFDDRTICPTHRVCWSKCPSWFGRNPVPISIEQQQERIWHYIQRLRTDDIPNFSTLIACSRLHYWC